MRRPAGHDAVGNSRSGNSRLKTRFGGAQLRAERHLGAATSAAAAEFLGFFYPIHYRIGLALEDTLRRGRLSRKQVAILWLLRSEDANHVGLPRKDVERQLRAWFEVDSPAVSKALRTLSRSPLGLVRIVQDPRSGRERRVILTGRGEQFLAEMVAVGNQFVERIIRRLDARLVEQGMAFLDHVSRRLDEFDMGPTPARK